MSAFSDGHDLAEQIAAQDRYFERIAADWEAFVVEMAAAFLAIAKKVAA